MRQIFIVALVVGVRLGQAAAAQPLFQPAQSALSCFPILCGAPARLEDNHPHAVTAIDDTYFPILEVERKDGLLDCLAVVLRPSTEYEPVAIGLQPRDVPLRQEPGIGNHNWFVKTALAQVILVRRLEVK